MRQWLLATMVIVFGYAFTSEQPTASDPRWHKTIEEARRYARQHKMDTSICFLLDLSIHNGRKRFFVYDFQQATVRNAGLVTHGNCNELFRSTVKYSNTYGSGCSAYGKYRVGQRYTGIFGRSYRLIGLDSSNSRAMQRAIVMHSHKCVPDDEVYPNQICNSLGCATVSPAFLQTLDTIIQQHKRPVLLWIING